MHLDVARFTINADPDVIAKFYANRRRAESRCLLTLLAEELAHAVRAMDAILDGEIVCLASDGRSLFHRLLFRREWPYFGVR